MASDPLNSESSDPLSGIYRPALFPRTFSASAANRMPPDDKILDSPHRVSKSLKQLRSPDKLMNDAKKIVDGRDRRPCLGISRPKGSFSLKATVSQPYVSLKPNLNTDQFQDPYEFLDAYERPEEIEKYLGDTSNVANQQRPSLPIKKKKQRPSLARCHRQGILWKSYTYKYRYSSASSENCIVPSPSQKMAEDRISNPLEGGPLENVISPFSSLSLLMKRIVKSSPLKDPFFPHDAEHSSCQKVSLVQPSDMLHQQVVESDDLRMPDFGTQAEAEIAEPIISNSDSMKMTETKDNYPHQVVNDETGGPYGDNSVIPNEESGSDIQKSDNNNNSHNRENPRVSSLEDEAVEGKSACSQNESEPHPEVYKRKRHVSDKAGQNHIRKAHPLRKSLADCGSSFETGMRKSKRIKMRPLEYWKGERFLYGRVDNSLELIGVKYLSPGNGDLTLKVKPYMSESAEIKELLDLESRY